MSYLVLARKYRPAIFADVVGQEHVTRTLRNAIRSGRLGHAFLFSGLRGVGKTSVARILAKTLNCSDEGHVDEPCGVCDSCVQIDGGRSLDVVEMDAASHTGVDDIRELREAVMYAPAKGHHKVYIIDEVHMLSRNAFNALLKTLEEPPPRVIFILATTEPHKVPVTIHSRCQRYDFRRIPSAAIADHLASICAREGVTISTDSLRRIATASEGSLRDSQSLLDQVISYSGEKVADEDVNVVLGSLDRDKLMGILSACTAADPGQALRLLGEMIDNGADPVRVALDLLEIMRSLMVLVEVPDPQGLLDLPEGEMEVLGAMASEADAAALRMQFGILARGEERMRRSPQPRFHLELALVYMARAGEIVPLGQEGGPSGGGLPARSPRAAQPALTETSPRKAEPRKTEDTEPAPAPAFAGIDTPEETWEQLVEFVKDRTPNIGSMLEHLVPIKVAGEALVIGGRKGEFNLDMLQEREKFRELTDLITEFFNREVQVKLVPLEHEERANHTNSVEKRQKRESDLDRKIQRETREHAAIRSAVEIFDGQIESVRVLGQTGLDPLPVESKEEDL